jgi:uncharacterized membrane protein YeaQ/YmgE (transglycosylase-associated protein family)
MGFQAWVVLGLMTGLVAKFVMPVDRHGGLLVTTCLGVGGAVAGGLIGIYGFGFGDQSRFDLRSVAMAVGGALLVLAVYGLSNRHRRLRNWWRREPNAMNRRDSRE